VLGLWLHETAEGKLLLTEDRWGKRALLTPEETLQVEQEARRLAEERADLEAKRAEQDAAGWEAMQQVQQVREAKAEAVLAVLAARGLKVSEAQVVRSGLHGARGTGLAGSRAPSPLRAPRCPCGLRCRGAKP
jgi:hypothetical protein